jgi:hypothetical protein
VTLLVLATTVSAQAAHGTGSVVAALKAGATLNADWTVAMDWSSSTGGEHPMPPNVRDSTHSNEPFTLDVLFMI